MATEEDKAWALVALLAGEAEAPEYRLRIEYGVRFPDGEVWKVSQKPTEESERAVGGTAVQRLVKQGPWLSEAQNRQRLLGDIYDPALQLPKPDHGTPTSAQIHWFVALCATLTAVIIIVGGLGVTYWGW